MISPFLNFDSSTGDFLKNAKISLVLLIGPFLIRTDCVYCEPYCGSYCEPYCEPN